MSMMDIQVETDINLASVYASLEQKEKAVIHIVAEYIREACPVRTGRMKRSIREESDGVSVNTDYACYVEYKTNWFSKAVSQARAAIIRALKED